MSPEQLVRSAMALVGAPFRLHGRDPATGLDCIGVLACALAGDGQGADPDAEQPAVLPNGYSLRARCDQDLTAIAAAHGFSRCHGPALPGDVLILEAAVCQPHLAILCHADQAVHAHAGLRRVVLQPAPLPWPILSQWRLPAKP